MAFNVITGTYTVGNDVIDALISAWDFDAIDQSSATHYADWGTTRLTCFQQNYVSLYRNGEFVSNGSITLNAAGGSYTIYKTENTLLCIVGDGALVLTTGVSVENPTDTDKITAMTHGYYAFACGTGGTWTINDADVMGAQIVTTTNNIVQLYPYLHANGGYKCNDLFMVRVASASTLNTRMYIGDSLYYVYHLFAIAER